LSDQPNPEKTIPTPMKLQWRRVRYQVLPITVFVVSLAATVYLWQTHVTAPHGLGEVSMESVKISAPQDGKLLPDDTNPFPRLYDRVDANKPIARIEANKALVEHFAQLEEALSARQDELAKAQKALEDNTDKSRQDLLKAQVTSLKRSVDEQRDEYQRVKRKIEGTQLVAPVSGTVTRVSHQLNEFVKQGEEIMTITQNEGGFIVSYVRPTPGSNLPKKDDRVIVRGQTSMASATSIVQEVGAQVQLIPEHQLSNPKRPEWGFPVRIALPSSSVLPLRPGELVVLNYQGAAK
jgi:hypothetical protein